MSTRRFHMHHGKAGAALAVRVTPRASRNRIAEITSEGTVRVHIAASPVDGEANAKLLEFLAKVLGIPKSRLEIVAGQSGRDKLVSVVDMDTETVHKRIIAHLD